MLFKKDANKDIHRPWGQGLRGKAKMSSFATRITILDIIKIKPSLVALNN